MCEGVTGVGVVTVMPRMLMVAAEADGAATVPTTPIPAVPRAAARIMVRRCLVTLVAAFSL